MSNYATQIIQKFADDYNLEIIKQLGSGGFGAVYEVKSEKFEKPYAAKILEKNEKFNESELILEFRGPNIVKVNKIYEKKILIKNEQKKENIYNLILMEKATLKDLKAFVKLIREDNILKYVFKNPFEMIGDNFARFIIKQLVKGFETLYMANFVHFDFKPENTLIFNNIVMKLTDFGFLRDLNKIKNSVNQIEIPGGTHGYFPPEYFSNEGHKITLEEVFKLDYFALGATIFYLKYGEKMLKYQNYEDNLITGNYIKELIQMASNKIKTTKSNDKDFINFLCKIIQYNPKDRLSFKEIQRNKWLNKNRNEILEVVETNQEDELKIIEELNKSDFLFEKKNYINKERKSIEEKNINIQNKRKEKHKINYHKFKLSLL